METFWHFNIPAASSAPSNVQLDAEIWDNKTITSGLKDYFR